MQRDLRAFENLEQFVFAPVQAGQQLVERVVAGAQGEYLIEAATECVFCSW